jgi:hypothetical protein
MTKSVRSDPLALGVVFLTLALGAFASALYTELGQVANLPSRWLYAVYPHLGWASTLVGVAALFVLYRHLRHGFAGRRLVVAYLVVIAGMIFVANAFVPYLWLRGHHHTASFISVSEADAVLDDDADVFVLEIGREARAYPRDWMQIPHIAGDTIAGEEVVMTYCALSNLPLAFDSAIDGEAANLKVVSQVHSNLVMADTNSGELYQQITGAAPLGSGKLAPRAAQRMPWRSFRELYPEGRVFHVVEPFLLRVLDRITLWIFDTGLEPHYNGPDPLFPTLRLDDDRLPLKEQIWGINIDGEQVAYARSFLERERLDNATIGGVPLVVAWFPEYETLGVFARPADVKVHEVDVHGNTPDGRLERLPQYPHVFWMVWSHWYPDTDVRK